jgi:hypothetical protein
MTWSDRSRPPRPAVIFTFIAYIPFLVAVAMAYGLIGPDTEFGRRVCSHYGAVMMGFIGGIHWGLAIGGFGALTEKGHEALYGTSIGTVAVSTAGLGLFLPTTAGLIALAIGFLLYLAFDVYASRHGLSPRWHGKVRNGFLFVAIASLLACSLVPAGTTPTTPHSVETHPLFGTKN